MPTPEENMQSVRTFAEEVIGKQEPQIADDWLPDDFVEHQVLLPPRPTRRVRSTPIASSSLHRPT
jgi:extradiol dioxygenase family protein